MDSAELTIIRALPGNDKCVDCGEPNPQWGSVRFGVLFCLSCSGKHRGLGTHVDFVRSITLDSWTNDQVEMMKAGGNDKCNAYFEEHELPSDSTLKERYTSDIAKEYKKTIAAEATGEASPTTSNGTPANQTSGGDDNSMSLQQIRQLDDPIAYSKVYMPYLGLLITFLTRSLSIPTIGIPYFVLGISTFFLVPDQGFLRVVWWTSLTLPPLVLGALYINVLGKLIKNRQPAFKSAQNLLWERIQSGRAKRLEEYDIFLPPSETTKASKKQGLIFFPGALVSQTAYSPLAAKLSDAGILVVVMSLEPTRIAMDASSCHKRALLVMYEVLTLGLGITVDEWNLGGHSMGASMATVLAAKMAPSKLILCGCITTGRDESGAPPNLKTSSTQVLVMNGSEDPYTNGNPEMLEEFQNALPHKKENNEQTKEGFAEYVTIAGGNHSGFAHYGPQAYPRVDGERKITMEEQQDAFVQKAVEFMSEQGKKKD